MRRFKLIFNRANPYRWPVLVLAIGIIILARGLFMPTYSVPNGRELLFNDSWRQKMPESNSAGQISRFEAQ